MAMVWPSAYSVALRLQRVPRALQGRVRVSRALHGREGRLTRLAPAPRALGGRAMSDDEQTQLIRLTIVTFYCTKPRGGGG